MERQSIQWLIPALLAIGAAAALWYYWIAVNQPAPEPVVAPATTVAEPQAMPEPLHPMPERERRLAERPQLVPLPPLDQSDDYFILEMSNVFGRSMEELLVASGTIERIVATVDNLPRAHVAERIRPVVRLEGQFVVDGQDGSGEFTINSSNFARYDVLVELLTSADLVQVVEVYRRFYPLFQGAYVDLGYPDGYFNDRLVEVIDHLLETPEISDTAPLTRPHVLYEFADPELEGLSSGQKLLLRMGAEHRSRVNQRLEELRTIITQM